MAKLTMERVNGIKTGYWSTAKKDDLIQRLGQIEHRSERLLAQACYLCRGPGNEQDELCGHCPLTILDKLIGGEYPPGI